MNDLLVSLLIIFGFYGSIFAAAWAAYALFSWIGNRLAWKTSPSRAIGSSGPTAPLRPTAPSAALAEWGTKIVETDEEVGMGWRVRLFHIAPAVAGVSEVMTVVGDAWFTPGLRCMIVVDRERITVLDREKQRGIRLESRWPWQGVIARLEGTTLRIQLFESTGMDGDGEARRTYSEPSYSERLFSVDLHSEAGLQIVPADWPGSMVLLPS